MSHLNTGLSSSLELQADTYTGSAWSQWWRNLKMIILLTDDQSNLELMVVMHWWDDAMLKNPKSCKFIQLDWKFAEPSTVIIESWAGSLLTCIFVISSILVLLRGMISVKKVGLTVVLLGERWVAEVSRRFLPDKVLNRDYLLTHGIGPSLL